MVCDRLVSIPGSVAHGADSDSLLLSGGVAKTGADEDAFGSATAANAGRAAAARRSGTRSEPDDVAGVDGTDCDSTACDDGGRWRGEDDGVKLRRQRSGPRSDGCAVGYGG